MLLMPHGGVPEPEDLRAEYEAAELHVGLLSSAGFQSAAIVIGGSIAGLAVLIAGLGTRAGSSPGVDSSLDKPVAAAITVLAMGAFAIIGMWRFNWSRYQSAVENHWVRMREIEHSRGMRKNIYMYLLTVPEKERQCRPEWQYLSEEEKKCFPKPFKELPEPPWKMLPGSGHAVLQATACLVQMGWLFIIVYVWIEAFRS